MTDDGFVTLVCPVGARLSWVWLRVLPRSDAPASFCNGVGGFTPAPRELQQRYGVR
jgi:hypothetical protein